MVTVVDPVPSNRKDVGLFARCRHRHQLPAWAMPRAHGDGGRSACGKVGSLGWWERAAAVRDNFGEVVAKTPLIATTSPKLSRKRGQVVPNGLSTTYRQRPSGPRL